MFPPNFFPPVFFAAEFFVEVGAIQPPAAAPGAQPGGGWLTLGGISLLCATQEQKDWVQHNIPQHVARPWLRRAFPGSRLTGIAWPTGFDPARPIEVGRLRWPGHSAMRFAEGFFLASADEVSAIRDMAFGADGRRLVPLTFHMESPGLRAAEVMEATTYLMPPVPLSGIRAVNGLYLLTVTCQRYYWWNVPSPEFPLECSATFDTLYDLCGMALAVAFPGWIWTSRDTIDPAYAKPSRGITALQDEPIPIVLDAIAANVGHRIAFGLDSSVRAVKYGTAQDGLSRQLGGFINRTIRAGGKRGSDIL